MKKISLILSEVEPENNTQNVIFRKESKMYKNSFEFLGPNIPWEIEKVTPLTYKVPLDNHYMVYHLFNQNGNHPMHRFICTKNKWQDFQFNWILKRTWIQNKDNVMWIINILVAVLACISSVIALS